MFLENYFDSSYEICLIDLKPCKISVAMRNNHSYILKIKFVLQINYFTAILIEILAHSTQNESINIAFL